MLKLDLGIFEMTVVFGKGVRLELWASIWWIWLYCLRAVCFCCRDVDCLNICVRVTARGVLAGKEALWQASSLFWSIDLTALADKDRGAVVLVLLQDWFLHRSKIVHHAEVYKCPWNQILECINIARRQF